jgi:hypothetical protein
MKVVRLSAPGTGRLYRRPRRCVASWVDPRAIERPDVLSQWKTPMTPSGIEPATFPLLAQCLNWLWVQTVHGTALQFPYYVILYFHSNDTFFYMGFSAVEIPTIFFHFHDKLVPHILFHFQHTALKNIVVILVVVVIFFSFIHYWWTIANIRTDFTWKVSINSSRTDYINKYCLFQQ